MKGREFLAGKKVSRDQGLFFKIKMINLFLHHLIKKHNLIKNYIWIRNS